MSADIVASPLRASGFRVLMGRRSSLCLLGLLALAATFGAACGGSDTTDATATATVQPGETDPLVAAIRNLPVSQDPAGRMTLGASDADVTLEVFEDFQCPFCLSFTATHETFLITNFVDTGVLRLVFRNYPILGAESLAAGRAAYCAGEQGMFWAVHRELFLVQAEAGQHKEEQINVGRFSDANLASLIARLGLDADKWSACYQSAEATQAVQEDVRAARAAGLSGTPGFVIDGRALAGAPRTTDAWQKLIDDARSD